MKLYDDSSTVCQLSKHGDVDLQNQVLAAQPKHSDAPSHHLSTFNVVASTCQERGERYWSLANLETGCCSSFKMSGAGKVDILAFSEAANSVHLHGVMPYAEVAAKYPTWSKPQEQPTKHMWKKAFEKKCDQLLEGDSTELPAAGARRVGFQLHMILKDSSSFDDALGALRS